jgi:hypothetical protein
MQLQQLAFVVYRLPFHVGYWQKLFLYSLESIPTRPIMMR